MSSSLETKKKVKKERRVFFFGFEEGGGTIWFKYYLQTINVVTLMPLIVFLLA